jgi:hypothetical protein
MEGQGSVNLCTELCDVVFGVLWMDHCGAGGHALVESHSLSNTAMPWQR